MPQPNEGTRESRGDLGDVQVRRHVHVCRTDELGELVQLDEAIVEDHALPDAEVTRETFEAEPIPFPLVADEVRVGRTQDDVDRIGNSARISGTARSMCSIPLFGESRPNVKATGRPSTPNCSLNRSEND